MIFGRVKERRREGRKHEDRLDREKKKLLEKISLEVVLTLCAPKSKTRVMFVFILNTSSSVCFFLSLFY